MQPPVFKRVPGSENITLQCAEWTGDDSRPPVVCVHGLSANCRCWDVMADALTPDYRVLAVDLRGRGLSDKPASGYSVGHHIQDLKCLMENLGLQRPVLMGHSLGALIVLTFAARYPDLVSGVILVDGAGVLTPEQMGRVMAGIKPSIDRLGNVYRSFDEYLEHMKKAPFLHPWLPAYEVYFQYETEAVDGGVRSRVRPEHIMEELRSLGKTSATDLYARVACPVLILKAPQGMLSSDDILLPPEALARMLAEIPAAEAVVLEGTNHFSVVFQANAQRDEAVRNFLRGVSSSARG